ncbi:hypothetical protein [Azospira sp. I09]|uniref:hypothetical protein n=1 Tax=Azospira sp. I09 TaxID=1765049 RepID=UPI001260B7E7|nr:hypothetical protein [Azospira sp. I09]
MVMFSQRQSDETVLFARDYGVRVAGAVLGDTLRRSMGNGLNDAGSIRYLEKSCDHKNLGQIGVPKIHVIAQCPCDHDRLRKYTCGSMVINAVWVQCDGRGAFCGSACFSACRPASPGGSLLFDSFDRSI